MRSAIERYKTINVIDKSNRHLLSLKESTRSVYYVAFGSLIASLPTLLLFQTGKIKVQNAETNFTSCGNHYNLLALSIFRTVRFAIFYLIPVTIIFFSYWRVYLKLRRHIQTRTKNAINPIMERERRAQKLITALSFVFAVTWGSYHASKLYVNWTRYFKEIGINDRIAFRGKL